MFDRNLKALFKDAEGYLGVCQDIFFYWVPIFRF